MVLKCQFILGGTGKKNLFEIIFFLLLIRFPLPQKFRSPSQLDASSGVYVVPGGAGGAMAHPDFGRSVNPTYFNQGGGTDYVHLLTTGTPRFSNLPSALLVGSF